MKKHIAFALALLFYASTLPWSVSAAPPKAKFSDLVLTDGGPFISARANASFDNVLATAANKTILVDSTITISVDKTIPSTVGVCVIKGGSFAVASGKTLTINGSFIAGLYRVFSGAGTVVFGVGSIPEAYPQWWGGNPDGTSSTAAISSAITATSKTYLSEGTWLANIDLSNTDKKHIYGAGIKTIILTDSASEPVIKIISDVSAVGQTRIHDLTLNGNNLVDGIYFDYTGPLGVYLSHVSDINIYNVASGIYLSSKAAGGPQLFANKFSNITITKFSKFGIYNSGTPEATNVGGGPYNIWENFAIYQPGDNTYAVYNVGGSNTFTHFSIEGVWYNYAPSCIFNNITIEQFGSQTVFPIAYAFYMPQGSYAVINGLQIIDTLNLFDNTVFGIGVGFAASINGITITNPNNPSKPINVLNDFMGGVFNGCYVPAGSPKIDTYADPTILKRWTFNGCAPIFTDGRTFGTGTATIGDNVILPGLPTSADAGSKKLYYNVADNVVKYAP